MPTPFSLAASLTYPPDDGQPAAIRDFSGSGNFDSKVEAELDLSGAGTQSVDMGTVANAKVVLIEVAPDSTNLAPVNVNINGGTDNVEISPGGSWLYHNPSPTTGISAIDIVYTDAKKVKVIALE
jgi:hypothetical protein